MANFFYLTNQFRIISARKIRSFLMKASWLMLLVPYGNLSGQAEKLTYTYYPTYNIVRCTQNNIFNLSYPVQKVSLDMAQGTVLGYVCYKEEPEQSEQKYALVLNSAKSDIIGIDIAHHASGLLHGPGIPVTAPLLKEPE